MDRELWKKTCVTVAAMLGTWLVVMGGMTIVAVAIASHAVAAPSSTDTDTDKSPAANVDTSAPVQRLPPSSPLRPRGELVPGKGHEAI